EGVRFQDFSAHLPDTRNLTTETNLNYHRACCPAGAIFSKRSAYQLKSPHVWAWFMLRIMAGSHFHISLVHVGAASSRDVV
ncbi:MAG: hypothetical protein OET18_17180, partial [Desulfobacterales bacterium]|nr:hypothetical protein [Desulfobacterales bacterium]